MARIYASVPGDIGHIAPMSVIRLRRDKDCVRDGRDYKVSVGAAEEYRSKYRVRGQYSGASGVPNGSHPAWRERQPHLYHRRVSLFLRLLAGRLSLTNRLVLLSAAECKAGGTLRLVPK